MIKLMPFQKGNKLHLNVSRKFGSEHHRFGKKLTEETRKKISQSRTGYKAPDAFRIKMSSVVRRGADHPNWKGGITPLNKILRGSLDYKLWRESVFKRDNWTCVWCGARNGNGKKVVLNADHIKPWSRYPDLRFAIDNGRTLCRPCHETTFKDLWKY